MIGKREDKRFEESKVLMLETDETVHVDVDLTPRIKVYSMDRNEKLGEDREETNSTEIGLDAKMETDKLKLRRYTQLLNWERIFSEVIEYKKIKKYWN